MGSLSYYVLTKKAAEAQARKEQERERRRSYEIEYLTYCDALAMEYGNVEDMDLGELIRQVDIMRKAVEKQEERIYVEDSVADIMPYPDKPFWWDMHQKPADKFHAVKCKFLPHASVLVILNPECYGVFIHAQDTAVADGDPVCVAA